MSSEATRSGDSLPAGGAKVTGRPQVSAPRSPRALLFFAPGFPTVDAPAIDDATLDEATKGLDVRRATGWPQLVSALSDGETDVLILPYGSAFPIDAWPNIRAFLEHGGGLVVLGGAPFHEPVLASKGAAAASGSSWQRTGRTVAFAHDLLLGPAEALPASPAGRVQWAAPHSAPDFHGSFPAPQTTFALTLRLATVKDHPDEHGSEGPHDTIARPLVHVVDAEGTARNCPLLELDHVGGRAAGARWLLATSDAKLDPATIRAIVVRALAGAWHVRAQPVRASIHPGEFAAIRVHELRPRSAAGQDVATQLGVVVTDEAGREVLTTEAQLAGGASAVAVTIPLRVPLKPGLYGVSVRATLPKVATANAATPSPSTQIVETGFVVRDEALLTSGPKLSVSRDWLRKDGQVFPVVGTTYMASDAHRKFLFEPNPRVWDADFGAMEKRGINFVRTGLWTAWSRIMLDAGDVDEAALSALEAYVQVAARHHIVVCFNFFAFLPPAHGGDNPYLDARALAGQRAFVTAFASRFRGNPWIHWDLINEPSYAPRSALWSTRPIGDVAERQAFAAWIERRHTADPGMLRALYHEPEGDPRGLPRPEDLSQVAVQASRRPYKARDFREFSDDVVAQWAAGMREHVRRAGGDVLVTLGQDEGGIFERPTQQRMAEALNYTSIHTWWKNDDLLWDGVLTKVDGKPSLHQETGLMRLEALDGTPWRSPEAAAKLLERKLAYAFAARGAGAVEWVWNVNPYMPIDEESTIGLLRVDGTAKPELDVVTSFATFARAAAPWLDDFAADPVVLVIPHARAFLGATHGLDATKVAVRTLAERFGVVPTAISDLQLTAARLTNAKLIVVPSPEVLDEPAGQALAAAVKAGAHLLITGPLTGDSYGRAAPSLQALGLLGPWRPVAPHESCAWSRSGWVAFEGGQESLRRAERPSVEGPTTAVWHEPLPLEFARDREPYVLMVGRALAAAAVPTSPGEPGVMARVLSTPRVALVVVVNERPLPATRRVVVDARHFDVQVAAHGTRLLLVERSTGHVLVQTPAPSSKTAR